MNNKLLSFLCIANILCAETEKEKTVEDASTPQNKQTEVQKKQGAMEIYNDCALLMSYFPLTIEPGVQQHLLQGLSSAMRDDSI
ncbi:MAG: hypothetical protein Q8K36_05585, partial [Alphaproteobacteria bacterium]|nr:hypothetical protein [Alphaproteobacteria bacterium]